MAISAFSLPLPWRASWAHRGGGSNRGPLKAQLPDGRRDAETGAGTGPAGGPAAPAGTAAAAVGASSTSAAPSTAGDEARLLVAAKYGDPDAFDALVAAHAAALHAVARRLVGEAAARDVVQDSLLAAYRSLEHYRGEASFGSYLHGIVVNRCRRIGRRRRPRAPAEALDGRHSAEPGPEERAVRADTRRRIEAALASLPARFREALALREFGELSYQEIAEALGVPLGTVRSRIARGRGLLRDELERRGVRP